MLRKQKPYPLHLLSIHTPQGREDNSAIRSIAPHYGTEIAG
jgi:hypothetical protein